MFIIYKHKTYTSTDLNVLAHIFDHYK